MKDIDEVHDDIIGLDMLFEPSAETEIEVFHVDVDTIWEDNVKAVEMTDVKGMSCLGKYINKCSYLY